MCNSDFSSSAVTNMRPQESESVVHNKLMHNYNSVSFNTVQQRHFLTKHRGKLMLKLL